MNGSVDVVDVGWDQGSHAKTRQYDGITFIFLNAVHVCGDSILWRCGTADMFEFGTGDFACCWRGEIGNLEP